MPEPATESAHLLVVEDDEELADVLFEYLGHHGFQLSHARTGDQGVAMSRELNPDLIILDLMLPRMSGLDVCRAIRHTFNGAIMMLTASQSESDHVAGLELGADDFVTKPVEPRVLLARIRTQLRRLRGGASPEARVLELAQLKLDVGARTVHFDARPVQLTAMEFDILLMLVKHVGSVVERERLYREVLQTEYDGIDRGMDVHISRIRRKLASVGFARELLKSVRGAGYFLARP